MKKLIKKLFLPPLVSRPVSAFATTILGKGVPIFMLHRIDTDEQSSTGITQEHLRNCLNYLTSNDYVLVSLEDIILSLKNNTPLPNKAVAFTMDDGFFDQGQFAAPIFLEYNCPLTFFVITGLIDKTLWPWDAQVSWIINNSSKSTFDIEFADETFQVSLGDSEQLRKTREHIRNILKEMDAELIPNFLNQLANAAEVDISEYAPASYEPLSWDKARELEGKGIRFAPHSVTHRILSKLSKESVRKEIVDSWHKLNEELSNPLKVFCYPTGRILDFGPREIEILNNEGFMGAVATVPGYIEAENNQPEHIFRLPRLELPDNMPDFIQYCSWIEHARTRNSRWS